MVWEVAPGCRELSSSKTWGSKPDSTVASSNGQQLIFGETTMPCAKQTFTGVSQDQFDCLAKQAVANGLPISGNGGEATKSGFTISWKYDPTSQILEIECLSAPFLVPCSIVNGKIHDLVDQCMQEQAKTHMGRNGTV